MSGLVAGLTPSAKQRAALTFASLCAVLFCTRGSLEAQQYEADAAIEAARSGGTIILCRHAITGPFREREPVDYDDPSTQRRLDSRGRTRAGGSALRCGISESRSSRSPRAPWNGRIAPPS